MNRISRGSSAVRRAARSPARSMIGPAVALIGHPELGRDHVGEAGLAHAGRAEEEHVVERLAAAAGGFDGDAQVRDDLGLADVLVEAARAQQTGRSRRRRRLGPAGDEARVGHGRSPPGEYLQRDAAGGPRSGRPCRPSQARSDAALGLRPRVAEVHEGRDEVLARRGRRRRPGRGQGWRAGGILSFSSSTRRSAVFLPTPGMRVRRATSPRAQGVDELGGFDAGEDGDRELGADAGDADQPLEERLLVSGEEAEEGQRVLADVGVDEQAGLRARVAQAVEGRDGDRRPGSRRRRTSMTASCGPLRRMRPRSCAITRSRPAGRVEARRGRARPRGRRRRRPPRRRPGARGAGRP